MLSGVIVKYKSKFSQWKICWLKREENKSHKSEQEKLINARNIPSVSAATLDTNQNRTQIERMWNKLFKKKQSKPSNKSPPGDAPTTAKQAPTKCFSFRTGRKARDEHHKFADSYQFLQYESEIYRKPGEAGVGGRVNGKGATYINQSTSLPFIESAHETRSLHNVYGNGHSDWQRLRVWNKNILLTYFLWTTWQSSPEIGLICDMPVATCSRAWSAAFVPWKSETFPHVNFSWR